MIDGKNVFDLLLKNDLRIYDNIQKITTSQRDQYTTGCLLDYPYFKKYYKIISIDLSKQQAFDAAPKAIQQINSTGILDQSRNTRYFSLLKKQKKLF